MSRAIRHLDTLVYYDMPQIFIGEDQIRCLYLCYILKDEEAGSRYLCTPVSTETLHNFKLGKTSLRDIFVNSELKEYYECIINDFNHQAIPLELFKDELTDDILPSGRGFVLDNFDIDTDEFAKKINKCPNAISKYTHEKLRQRTERIKIDHNMPNMAAA
jgi:hypothetical protein